MKKTAVALCLCVGSLLSVAFAQTGETMTVKLPYAANAGSISLPAGEYTVRELQVSGNAVVVEISSRTGATANLIASEIPLDTGGLANRTELVLKSDGEKYQIDKIWIAGRPYGLQLFK